MSFPAGKDPGSYVPLTHLLTAEDVPELVEQLRRVFNDLAQVINVKDSGYYVDTEFTSGQQWIPGTFNNTAQSRVYRPVFRLVVDFGALPNNATKNVAHGLSPDENWAFTRIYGAATDPSASSITRALPLPYASDAASESIQLDVDATNVRIVTKQDYSAYTKSFVVLEYIKSA